MGAWPVDNISTSSVDSQADKPDRGAFLNVFRRVKEMIGARGSANGVASLDRSGRVPDAQLGRGLRDGVAPLGSDSKLPAANLPGDLAGVPVGVMLPYPGGGISLTLDWGWAHCDGRWLAKSEYRLLWDRNRDRYLAGAAARSDRFRLPDARGRMLLGYRPGTYPAGSRGGAASARLTAAHMPEHFHHLTGGVYDERGLTHLGGGNYMAISDVHTEKDSYTLKGRSGAPNKGRTSTAGSASPTPVPTMPPYLAVEWIIRTK